MEELELREIFRIIGKRLKMIVGITLLAAIISGVLSFFVIKPQYDAQTTLLVNKKEAANQQLGVQYNDIMANEALVKTYNQIIKSRSIAENVIQKLNLNLTTEQFDNLITVNSVDQSQVISVDVKYTDPHMAVQIANTIADTFTTKVKSLMQVENVQIVDKAVDQDKPVPVSPKKSLNIAIAFVVGLMVSVGLAFLLEYLDNTIKSEEDVQRILELPVIGTIALMEDETNSKTAKNSSKQSQSNVPVSGGVNHGA